MTGRERPKRADFQGCALDSEKIPWVLGMQRGLNSLPMVVGVMRKGVYSILRTDLDEKRIKKGLLLTQSRD
jgi:hypothetical protein